MSLQHLRSSTANKRPVPGNMSDGQIAINTNTGSPGLFFKDSNNTLVKVGPVHVGTTAPNASPAAGGTAGNSVGEQWLDTTGGTYVFKVWDGSAWRSETGTFVDVNGDVMTGALGIIAGSDGSPGLYFSGDTNTGLYSPGADQVAISTGGSERLRITSAGLVGVGTSSPSTTTRMSIVDSASAGIYLLRTAQGETVIENTGSLTIRQSSGNGANQNIFFKTGTSVGTEVTAMTIDGSQRVGIGTASPSTTTRMSIVDSTSAGIYLLRTAQGEAVIENTGPLTIRQSSGNGANQNIFFKTGASVGTEVTAMTIDGSQRVGIGDSAPGTFDVRGAKLTLADSVSDGIGIKGRRDSLDRWYVGYNSSDQLEINQIRNNALAFKTNNAEVARLTNSGQLLVGTSSARGYGDGNIPFVQVERATIGGDIANIGVCNNGDNGAGPKFTLAKSRSGSNGGVTVVQNGDSLGSIQWSGADGTDIESVAAQITCNVDGTPGANDMPGRLVFSTTADGASSPTERMRISSAGQTYVVSTYYGATIISTETAGTSVGLIEGKHSGTAGSITGATTSFTVWTNGNVVNTNNSYGAISDIKLKENIVDAGSQWDDIRALQIRKYNFKEGQTHTQIGLIAQEVELVSPGLVTESPDRDGEGNDLGTVTKSVNYSVLYMKAVKALQEAMERIETLEAKVAALESA
jgi:hypothetical protein